MLTESSSPLTRQKAAPRPPAVARLQDEFEEFWRAKVSPEKSGNPALSGQASWRGPFGAYWLPNAYPRQGEFLFGCGVVLFVDDEQEGKPVAF